MEGHEVWQEWTEQTMEETERRREVKRQWREMEQATVRRGWNKGLERDKVYDRSHFYVWSHFYYPLLIVNFINLFNKNDLHEKSKLSQTCPLAHKLYNHHSLFCTTKKSS